MAQARFNKDATLDSATIWPAWLLNIEVLLGEDAAAHLKSPIPQPSAVDKDEEGKALLTEWRTHRHAAAAAIMQTVKIDHHHLLQNCAHDPHRMFLNLKAHFQPDSHLDKVSLMQQYFSLRLESSQLDAVDAFLKDYQNQLNTLRQLDISLKDDWQTAAHLLATLPSQFNTLKSIIGNETQLPTVEALIAKIRTETKNINCTDDLGSSSALAAAHKTSKRPPPGPCPCCKEFHWLKDCKHPSAAAVRKEFASKREARRQPAKAASADTANLASINPATGIMGTNDGLGYAWLARQNGHNNAFYIDSGCTWSLVGDERLLSDIKPIPHQIIEGVGGQVKATAAGTLYLQVSQARCITLTGVRLSKGLPVNLISVQQLNKCGFNIDCGEVARAYDPVTGKTIFNAPRVKNGLYQLTAVSPAPHHAFSAATLTTWHHRLCHLNADYIRTLARDGHVDGMTIKPGPPLSSCTSCSASKAHRISFHSSSSRATAPLELVHCDLLTFGTPSMRGAQYLLVIVDDYSRKLFGFPLYKKSDALASFLRFQQENELQTGHKLKTVRSDNGGEFSGHQWLTLMSK